VELVGLSTGLLVLFTVAGVSDLTAVSFTGCCSAVFVASVSVEDFFSLLLQELTLAI
jgi:hypothetical protein